MLVAILGTGLIGSSVGLAARAAGDATIGWDLNPETAGRAERAGALESVAASPAEAIARADTIVVAAPLEGSLRLLRSLPPAPRASLIIDTVSVKVPIVAAAASLPKFVATHPLAGSERRGPEAASAELFSDRNWVYVAPGSPGLEARVRAFIEALGARPLPVEAARHDAVVALTSHLPQVLSTALGAMLNGRRDDPLVTALCGTGMRSMTRLAASEWLVWAGTLEANSQHVAQEVRALGDILRSVAEALETGSGDPPLAALFAQAADAAAALRMNAGAAPFVSFEHTERHDDSR